MRCFRLKYLRTQMTRFVSSQRPRRRLFPVHYARMLMKALTCSRSLDVCPSFRNTCDELRWGLPLARMTARMTKMVKENSPRAGERIGG